MDSELPLTSDVRRYFQEQTRGLGKRERTRAAILDGVIHAIAEVGLEATTVKEVAENASVSHGTFYNHFDSRGGAILAAVAAVKAELLQVVRNSGPPPEEIDQALVAGIHTFMQTARHRRSWGRVLGLTVSMVESGEDRTDNMLQELLLQGQAMGVFRVEITPLLCLQIRVLQGLAMLRGTTGSKRELVPTCEAVLRLLGRTPQEAETAVNAALEK